MFGESTQHAAPELCIRFVSGSTVDILVRMCCLVVVTEREFPWNHREACYLLVYAARHHELDPAVEDCEIVEPCAVGLLYPCYHAAERVICLPIPGTVYESSCNSLLACRRQFEHIWTQNFEVLVAPYLNIVDTGHGIRVLP